MLALRMRPPVLHKACLPFHSVRYFSVRNKPKVRNQLHEAPSVVAAPSSSSSSSSSLPLPLGTPHVALSGAREHVALSGARALDGFSFRLPSAIKLPWADFSADADKSGEVGGGTAGGEDGGVAASGGGDGDGDTVGVTGTAEEESASDSDDYYEVQEDETAAEMSPKDIKDQLDRFIVGQDGAKKAVALALRNRWRRKKLPKEMKEEIMPKNILMIGPTGVGKTEVARRLAKLTHAPFIKVEATKFTEVGFHGKDVDSIIKDLTEVALNMVRVRKRLRMKKVIDRNVENKILDALCGKSNDKRSRKDFREHYRSGVLDDQSVNIEVPMKESEVRKMYPKEASAIILNKDLGLHKAHEKRRMKISECRPLIEEFETERLVNTDDVSKEAIEAVQQDGIVFLDEIDKICSTSDRIHSADASSEGVQRDLLPLIEGSTISTKHGNVDTDYILFVASGAFHSCKPSDLLAELQGRLPIRVQLQALSEADLYKILTEPETNLIKQQVALMSTEEVDIVYHESATREIARVAHEVNTTVENIGARRLHTVIEKVMEEISYESDANKGKTIEIDDTYVRSKVESLLKKHDLSRFVL